jgi:hypothetical protein
LPPLACPSSAFLPRGCRVVHLWPWLVSVVGQFVDEIISVVGRLVEQMIEVGHHAVDQLAAAQIACIQALRQEAKQIACLLDRLRPVGGGCDCQQVFEFRLSRAQRFLVGFDLGPQTAKVGRLLGCPCRDGCRDWSADQPWWVPLCLIA